MAAKISAIDEKDYFVERNEKSVFTKVDLASCTVLGVKPKGAQYMKSQTEPVNNVEVLKSEAAQAGDPGFSTEGVEEDGRKVGGRLLQALERLFPHEQRGLLEELADEARSLLVQWHKRVERSTQKKISQLRTEVDVRLPKSPLKLDMATKADLEDIQMQLFRLRRDIARLSSKR